MDEIIRDIEEAYEKLGGAIDKADEEFDFSSELLSRIESAKKMSLAALLRAKALKAHDEGEWGEYVDAIEAEEELGR